MNLIVTVDVEADNQWEPKDLVTIENVFALPRFQALCEKYAVVPTYFTTYEVASDARAAAMLKGWQDAGKAEVGAHLHPWTTPPYAAGEKGQSFPSELSDDSLRQKFVALTDVIEKNIGRRPTSYRAGRWGFDMRQAALLAEFGYRADSSITPSLSWRKTPGLQGGPGGPDFSRESAAPRMLNETVLEVPMTVLPPGFLRRPRWLRIFANTTRSQLVSVIRMAKKKGLPAVFMIHSSELVPAGSPYVKDAAALEAVYAQLEELFIFCEQEEISGISLTEFAKGYLRVRQGRGERMVGEPKRESDTDGS
ncbi:MAG: hypothetical protein ACREGR_03135 [Minisyncoccia bacterium]